MMADELAKKLLEMDERDLAELLRKLRTADNDAYRALKECLEETL